MTKRNKVDNVMDMKSWYFYLVEAVLIVSIRYINKFYPYFVV